MTPRPIFDLLPLIYREKDAEGPGALSALAAVLERGHNVLAGDLARLYDGWFVETCAPELLPYIADLLQVPGLAHGAPLLPSDRRRVGNAVGWRRRKGTLAALAGAVADATGWAAHAVEGAPGLAATQDLAALRPGRGGALRLGGLGPEDTPWGPFSTAAHGIDLRDGPPRADRAAPEPISAAGAHGLDAVALFLWRLKSVPVQGQELLAEGHGRFRFHPLGVDAPLFRPPRRLMAPGDAPDPADLPLPLTREALRRALAAGEAKPLLQLAADWGEGRVPVDPAGIAVADLARWHLPGALRGAQLVVDPETGRAVFPGKAPDRMWADVAQGAVAELGGGAYERPGGRAAMAEVLAPGARVFRVGPGGTTLADALAKAAAAKADALVLIEDSGLHPTGGARVEIAAGRTLTLAAANGEAPALLGDLGFGAAGKGAALVLDGLRLGGRLHLTGPLSARVADATLGPPGTAAEGCVRIEADGGGAMPSLTLVRAIAGPVAVSGGVADLAVTDSILDGGGEAAVHRAAEGPRVSTGARLILTRATVLGALRVEDLAAVSDSIVTGAIETARASDGYLRFSYAPPAATTGLRYRCVPAPRAAEATGLVPRPRFTSTRYGDPAYGQLAFDCPEAILHGAETGAEMGAYCSLQRNLCLAGLRAALDEFLPFGARVKVFLVT